MYIPILSNSGSAASKSGQEGCPQADAPLERIPWTKTITVSAVPRRVQCKPKSVRDGAFGTPGDPDRVELETAAMFMPTEFFLLRGRFYAFSQTELRKGGPCG